MQKWVSSVGLLRRARTMQVSLAFAFLAFVQPSCLPALYKEVASAIKREDALKKN